MPTFTISKERLHELYWNDGLSYQQIAEKEDVSAAAVMRAMRRLQIRGRTNAESQTCINISRSITFTEQQRQLVLGTLLGDGCLHRQKFRSNKTTSTINTLKLHIYHSEKQLPYLMFKHELLGMGSKTKRPLKLSTRISGFGSIMKGFAFAHTPTLEPFAALCLDGASHKHVNEAWLREVSWEGIAYWYQDDGSIEVSRNNRRIQRTMIFHCNSYTQPEKELLVQMLARFGIASKITPKYRPTNPAETVIKIWRKDSITKLIDNIKPFILPSMNYKIRATILRS